MPAERILILKAGDLLAWCHPAVLLAIDPDEHLALRQVRPIEITRRMRTRAEFEHRRSQMQATDRGLGRGPLRGQFPQGRRHEDPQPLIRSTNV
jgi:hypothetical protein